MFSYKKIVAIVTSVLYIFVNYDFYNSIFHEYTNDRLFHTTTYLGIVELVFFIMLFLSVFQLENMETKKKGDKTRAEKEKEGKKDARDLTICFLIFIASLICINISRVILTSSPYINDIASTASSYTTFIGGTRVLFIFSSIMLIFIATSRRNALLIIISAINFIISIMIWLDFDANVTAIMRIFIAILAIIYYFQLKDGNTVNANKKYKIKSSKKQIGNNQ